MNILAIISSKSPNHFLHENVFKIKNLYKDAKIVIVDSDSDDFTVYDRVRGSFEDVDIQFIKNKNYEYGAWKHGFNLYPNYDIYICLQDSISFDRYLPLNHITDNTAYTCHHKSGFFSHPSIKECARQLLNHSSLPDYDELMDTHFLLAQHSSFIVTKNRLKDIIESLPNPPIDKKGSCSYERIFGMYFILKQVDTISMDTFVTKQHGLRM